MKKWEKMLSIGLSLTMLLTTLFPAPGFTARAAENTTAGTAVAETSGTVVPPEGPQSAPAQVASGTCGDSAQWVLTDDGTLTVSGSGAMYNYAWNSSNGTAPWKDYSSIKEVVVESGITTIGGYSFLNCLSLTAVTIPEGVTTIGECAFYNCRNLTSVTIPESVTTIGTGSFQSCISLSAVTIPQSVTTIGRSAFYYCSKLLEITVNENNLSYASIHGALFSKDCKEIICVPGGTAGAYTIPEGVTTIGNGAFYDCRNLTSVTIPEGVTTICENAFAECRNLAAVTMPGSINSIGRSAFNCCNSLTAVTIPEGVTTIGSSAFWGCISLSSVTIPRTVSVIDDYAFEQCNKLATAYIDSEEGTVSVAPNAFPAHTKVTYRQPGMIAHGVTIGSNLTWTLDNTGKLTITGTGEMQNAPWQEPYHNQITSVVIGSGVTSIAGYAFSDCVNMTSVEIPDSVTSIGVHAFAICSSLTSVRIPTGLTVLPDSAFVQCGALTEVRIPEGVSKLDVYAFADCSALKAVYIPLSVKTIDSYAFGNCHALENVHYYGTAADWDQINIIPHNPELLNANRVYLGQDNPRFSIVVENSVGGTVTVSDAHPIMGQSVEITAVPDENYILEQIFLDGKPITETHFVVSGNHTVSAAFVQKEPADSILASGTCGPNAQWVLMTSGPLTISGSGEMTETPWKTYKDNIKRVIIENGITAIATYAFSDCPNLEQATLPDSLRTINDYAFTNCALLQNVTLPASLTSIHAKAFAGCSSITSMMLPEGITTIAEYTFDSCSALEEIQIPVGVKTVKPLAFAKCSSLQTVNYAGSREQWDQISIDYGNEALISAYGLTLHITVEAAANGTVEVNRTLAKQGDTITVTAVPAPGYKPVKILVDGKAIEGNTFLVTGDHVVSAEFEKLPVITVAPEIANGSVTIEDRVYQKGDTVTVTAGPAFGYKLVTVLVDGSPIDGNTFIVTGDHVVSAVFSTTSDKTIIQRGTCGEQLSWILYDDRELYIGGTGAMSNYAYHDAPWYAYRSQIQSVRVDEGISNIGRYAFDDCVELKSVEIPETVTAIGDWAFGDCDKLVTATIPASVQTIGASAFDGCIGLEAVTLFSNLQEIRHHAFDGCTALEKVFFVGTEEQWGTMTIGRHNQPLLNAPRSYITALDQRYIVTVDPLQKHGRVTLNGKYFASGERVEIHAAPDSQYIFDSVLVDHQVIHGTSFNAAQDHVVSVNFILCEDCIGSGSCGEDLRWVLHSNGELHISGTGDMTEFSSAQEYPWYSVRGEIKTIVIDEGAVSIGANSFADCGNVTDVKIPSTVNRVGKNAFVHCAAIRTAEFLGNAPQVELPLFPAETADHFVIYYHPGTTGWTTPKWNGYPCASIGMPDEYSELDANNRNSQGILFTLNESSGTATVGDRTTKRNNAGYTGSGNGKVVIPDVVVKDGKTYKVIAIGQSAFRGNPFLREIHLGKNIMAIAPSALWDCPQLESITVSLDNIYFRSIKGVLYDLSEMALYCYPEKKSDITFTIPDSVKTISQYALKNCRNLKEIIVPESVTAIQESAFFGCDNLEKITLPFIGGSGSDSNGFSYVFGEDLKKLTTAVITGSEWLKGEDFKGSKYLENIVLSGVGSAIPNSSFADCGKLSSLKFDGFLSKTPRLMAAEPEAEVKGTLNIPEGITDIQSGAFSGCGDLKRIELPASLNQLGGNAFSHCTGVEEFAVSESNTQYSTDQWGVLFSKNKDVLINYPTARSWPHYNVPDETKRIAGDAFFNCQNLSNLYIPKTVTEIENQAVQDCGNTTICAYQDSYAFTHGAGSGMTLWPMDNFVLQSIEVRNLPESLAMPMGSEDLTGLYVVKKGEDGTELQADDYEVTYSSQEAGLQSVLLSCDGHSTSFEVLRYDPVAEAVLTATGLDAADCTTAMIALYDKDNRMLDVQTAVVSGSKAQIVVPKDLYDQFHHAKAFQLNRGFAPVGDCKPAN